MTPHDLDLAQPIKPCAKCGRWMHSRKRNCIGCTWLVWGACLFIWTVIFIVGVLVGATAFGNGQGNLNEMTKTVPMPRAEEASLPTNLP